MTTETERTVAAAPASPTGAPTPNDAPFLEIDGLYKRFGGTEVLRGINLSLPQGGFLVLVGPSGCGKSTLLNTIAGLESISDGEIRIDRNRVNELHPSRRDIAMVFQSYALYPNMTVAENISFGMEMRGVAKAERQQAVNEVAQTLQIGNLLERKPSQLSGGQRQRVAMGRALVRNPKIFLFDEPLSNLDAKLRVEMRTEIKRLHQRLGTTIVYVTHDQIEAMTLATEIAVLRDGALQQVGRPDEIYRTPANVFVADFMGSPSMNLLSATVITHENTLAVQLQTGAGTLAVLPLHQPGERVQGYLQREVTLGLRPETIGEIEGGEESAPHRPHLQVDIDVTEPTGADLLAVFRLGGKEAVARLRAESLVQAGQRAEFQIDMTKAVLFDADSGERI